MFEILTHRDDDMIETIFRRCAEDPRMDKMNLSIGVFRDASGEAPILPSVKTAEARIVERQKTKTYVSPLGNRAYAAAIEHLVLGAGHPALTGARVRTAQTPGAGAALRVAAEIIRSLTPQATVWFSRPVWAHQVDFFRRGDLAVDFHAYYDWTTHRFDCAAMLDSLSAAKPGDVLVLHAACHNPTGEDPTLEDWAAIADFCNERGLFPVIDSAYQGYGEGIEHDAAGLRLMAERVPQLMIAVSSSKSFAVYRDRVGALMLITRDAGPVADRLYDHMGDLIRGLYFMPPDLGAEIIALILSDPDLTTMWRAELKAARDHVYGLRRAFVDAAASGLPGFDARYMLRQKGMFSCLPLSDADRLRLEKDSAIYLMPDGRLNFASLSEQKIPRLLDGLRAVGLG